MTNPNRAFKGVWIPKEIWEHPELSMTERCLLAEIDSLSGDNGCYASREYLAERMGKSVQHVVDMITKLRKLGLIIDLAFDGRTQIIATAWSSDGIIRRQTTGKSVGSIRENPLASEATPIVLEKSIENSKILDKTLNTPEEVEGVLGGSALEEYRRGKEAIRARKKTPFVFQGVSRKPTPYQKKERTVFDGRGIR